MVDAWSVVSSSLTQSSRRCHSRPLLPPDRLRRAILPASDCPLPALLGVWTSLPMLGGSTAILIAAELSTVRL